MDPVNVTLQYLPPMPPVQAFHFFNPLRFGSELIYAIIVTALFLFIFYKTKHLFDLTKHNGIKYFRVAFLFFAFAYISRFLFYVMRLIIFNTNLHVPGRFLSFASLILVTYFSTLAIGYLIYSSVWKKINHTTFVILVNVLALITISIFYLRYPLIYFLLIQLSLMTTLLLINTKKRIRFVYPLISLFWIFNLIIFHTRRLLGFEAKLILQIASILLLVYFIYRILKWTK